MTHFDEFEGLDDFAESLNALDNEVVEQLPPPRGISSPFKYVGSKNRLAKTILSHLPKSNVYVEPFCGSASIFWAKEPWRVEVLNDIDREIINFFRVIQSEDLFRRLRHRILWTPYSLEEFRLAYELQSDDPVDRAWSFYVRCNQGFSGIPTLKRASGWSKSFQIRRGLSDNNSKWRGRMKLLSWWHDRISRVQLDCRDAIEVIRYWDSRETVFYIDPPYVHSTRKTKSLYNVEMTDEQHHRLIDTLAAISGQAVVSGYRHSIYDRLTNAGYQRIDIPTACHAAIMKKSEASLNESTASNRTNRTECLWVRRYEPSSLFPTT